MQAAAFGVDAVEAGGDTRKAATRIERLFDIADGLGRCGQEALHRAGFAFTLGDFIQRAFRSFNLPLGIYAFTSVQRIVDQSPAHRHKLPQQCQIVNLLGKVARANQACAIGGEFDQITRPAQFTHRFVGFKKRLQRDRRDQHVAVNQAQNMFKNPPVQRFKKMVRLQLDRDILNHAIIDEDSA